MKSTYISLVQLFIASIVFGQSQYGDYRVVVDVEGNGFAHSTLIYFDDESWDPQNPPSYSWDPCCDALLVIGNTDQPHVFTEVVEPPAPANNSRLSINGLPHLFEQTDVPLGFLPGTLAPYTFSFSELHTLPTGVTVELEDLSLNVVQDLLVDSTYDTWGAPADDEQRFMLHFYPSNVTALSNEESFSNRLLIIRKDDQTIEVSHPELSNGVVDALLFDGLGRKLVAQTDLSGVSMTLNSRELAAGVYTILVHTESEKNLFGRILIQNR